MAAAGVHNGRSVRTSSLWTVATRRRQIKAREGVYSTKVLTAGFAGAVVDLTRQLVAFDSVNPGLVPGAVGEGPIAQFVADRLSGSGFEVRLVPALSDPRRMSVIAVRDGGRPGRTVVLNGHLDTVGVDGMAEPFTARIDGDRMFGRGTSDMKGGSPGSLSPRSSWWRPGRRAGWC